MSYTGYADYNQGYRYKNPSSSTSTKRQTSQSQQYEPIRQNQTHTTKIYDWETDSYITAQRPSSVEYEASSKIDFTKFEPAETRDYAAERAARRLQREKEALKQRIIAGAAALTVALGGIGLAISGSANSDSGKKSEETSYVQTIDATETQNPNKVIIGGNAYTTETEEAAPITEAVEQTTPEENTAPVVVQKPEITNPDAQKAYDKITHALDTFNSQLGEDGLALIRDRVEQLGNGRVDVFDVLKILAIESDGRIYDNNGNYLVSYTGEAFGPFQVTPDTGDYANYYFGLTGSDALDIMDPYDNLDASILTLRILKANSLEKVEKGIAFPSGINNVMEAVFWGYHDGAWADSVTSNGKDYVEKFRALSVLDNYPDVVEYLTQHYSK